MKDLRGFDEPTFQPIRRKRDHGHHMRHRIPPRCNGKCSYRSEELADDVRRELLQTGRAATLNVYRCPYCFYWHLTHHEQRGKNNRKSA
jgi:hypothetical protein